MSYKELLKKNNIDIRHFCKESNIEISEVLEENSCLKKDLNIEELISKYKILHPNKPRKESEIIKEAKEAGLEVRDNRILIKVNSEKDFEFTVDETEMYMLKFVF